MTKMKSFISKADLFYTGIDRIPEAGMPVGNGRMGSLIWFDRDEMHMQWNRSDVFANDATTQSFREESSDYSAGCGMIDLCLGTGEDAVFTPDIKQHLSVYDGTFCMEADQVKVETFMDMDQDICYIHIQDHRNDPQKIRLSLRTLRGGCMYVTGTLSQVHPSLYKKENYEKINTYVQTGEHLATSVLERQENVIRLRQFFEEKEYICQSFLEVKGFGRETRAFLRNQNEAVLEWKAGNEDLWITIQTAQAFKKEELEPERSSALSQTDFEEKKEKSLNWWHAFWERMPKMDLHSKDGDADLVSLYSTWFYYLMACTSRGEYMARFGGLLFYSAGDFRYWGAQFWWHNQACYYSSLVSQGCFEMADAFYNHILNSFKQYEKAAWQQWGSKGIFIPETCWFSGPCDIPEDLIEEVQALFTLKKPWEERSNAYREFARGRNLYETRWNGELVYNRDGKGYGPYGFVTHIFSTTAKIAMLFWKRYMQTLDKKWLEEKGYPVIKGTAQMYCNLPFLQEGEDGMLHFYHVNDHEGTWDGTDTISELSGVHGILPVAVRAAQILGVDEELQKVWKETDERIVPIRTNEDPGALTPRKEGEKVMWCCGTKPAKMSHGGYYHNLDAVNIYHLLTLETPKGRIREIGENTYERSLKEHAFGTEQANVGELEPFIISPSKMGHKEAVECFVPMILRDVNPENFTDRAGTANTIILDNRMTLREGVQALGAQRIGQASESIATALCSCVPASPGEEPVLHLFAAYPDSWDADFKLPAANGYWVQGEKKDGQILKISLSTDQNSELKVRNPWGSSRICIDYGNRKEYTEEEKFTVKGSCTLYAG